ncbi:MAG: hypothetical protein M1816_002098 [Peltula sp. TS41687]|nr:MAG: hypothetical protein M1816_002098 [Peltula sp. TS41687]
MAIIKDMAFLLPREMPEPGILPPVGVTPDFIHPESRANYCIAVHTVVLTIATLFLAVRMYVKLRITRSPGWDDYTIVLAWITSIAYSGVGLAQLQYGLGVHGWNVPLPDIIKWRQLSNVEQTMYPMLIFVLKLSILLLYRRIFAPSRRTKVFIGVIVAFLFFFYLSNMIVKIFSCTPRKLIWDKRIPGHCTNPHTLYLVTAIVNVISDFYILLLPLPAIWHLQVPLARRIGLMLAFSAGLFACITSIVRLAETIKHASYKDASWEVLTIHLWTVIEINVGIACACMPALPSFYHHFFPRRQTSVKLSYAKDSFGSRKTNPTANLGPDDARLMQGKYLELNQTNRRLDKPSVMYSTVRAEGGGCGIAKGKDVDLDDGGILRTIDVEQCISHDSGSAPSGGGGGSEDKDLEAGLATTYHHRHQISTTTTGSR